MKRKNFPTLREAKYKKTVEAVYGDTGPNTHNIQSLQQYALMTPGKLPKIGKYVLNKAKEGLKEKKKGIRTVETSMIIFNELINTCHNDLALFASPICDMMRSTLTSPFLSLKAAGTETFIRFSEHGGIQYELEEYVQYFIDMSSTINEDNIKDEKTIRALGLRGLHSYIVMTEDLDNLIAQFVDNHQNSEQTSLLPIFLDNMQYKNDKRKSKKKKNNEDLRNASIIELGTLCLKDMSSRVNHITIRPLCESLLSYIDERKLWNPNQFAKKALKTLSIGVLPQLKHTIIRFLLEHIDKQDQKDIETKTSIIHCITDIIPQKSISQQMSDVLTCMIHQITLKDGFNETLAKEAVLCISLINEKQIDPLHQLDSLRELLLHIGNPISFESKLALCNAILGVVQTTKSLPLDKSIPSSLIERWCVASIDKNPIIREKILKALPMIFKQTNLLVRASNKSIRNSTFTVSHEHSISQIHSSLLTQLQYNNNTYIHYELIYDIHCKCLKALKYVGLISLLPNLFHLQKINNNTLKEHSACIHTLIAALFSKISVLFKLSELSNYVSSIYTKRKEENQLSSVIILNLKESIISISDNNDVNNDKDIQVDILFNNNKIIELLSLDKELISICDLQSLLDKDISNSLSSSVANIKHEISEERKIRKQLAVGITRNNNNNKIEEKEELKYDISTFKELLHSYENKDYSDKSHLYPLKDYASIISKKNVNYYDALDKSFTNLSLECDDINNTTFMDLNFPLLVDFIQKPIQSQNNDNDIINQK